MIFTPDEARFLESWNLRFIADLHAASALEHELAGDTRAAQVCRAKAAESPRQANALHPPGERAPERRFVIPLETAGNA